MATTNQIALDKLKQDKQIAANKLKQDREIKDQELDQRKKEYKRDADLREKTAKHNRTMDYMRSVSKGVKWGVDGMRDDLNQAKGILLGSKSKSTNDPAWYKEHPGMFRDATQLQTDVALGYHTDAIPNKGPNGDKIPGICVLRLFPTYGISADNSSILNMAKNEQYQWVRYMNNGHTNYEAADLMQILIAVDNLSMFYAFMLRAYALLMTYSSKNRYMARYLFEENGLDFEDFHKNILDYRAYIANWAARANQFSIPTLNMMKRHLAMFSSVYTDQPYEKTQLYMFVPDGFHFYDWAHKELEFQEWSRPGTTYKVTFADLIAFGDRMIASLAENEDVAIMAGDIRKAYTDSELVNFPTEIEPNMYITPVYDEYMLSAIENATLIGSYAGNSGNGTITQSGTALICNASYLAVNPPTTYDTFRHLNFHKEKPTEDDIIESTRLTPGAVRDTRVANGRFGENRVQRYMNLPADAITYATIAYLAPDGTLKHQDFSNTLLVNTAATFSPASIFELVAFLAIRSSFEHLPYLVAYKINATEHTGTPWAPTYSAYKTGTIDVNSATLIQQLDTLVPLSLQNINNLNDMALLSLFNVKKGGR